MRIAVVDDERPARSELVYLIRQCSPSAEITEADSSDRLMELLNTEVFDVCFVDIDLGGANGTTLASMIKSKVPEAQIIFATAYREYAVKAFELGAADYLLKPFDLDRVKKTMGRLEEKRAEAAGAREMAINKIMVNAGASFQVLDVSDIESLNYYETRLKNCRFFRIHKSYLVNLDYVLEMVPAFNNGYSLKMKYHEKVLLPIGRTQVREFRQLFAR